MKNFTNTYAGLAEGRLSLATLNERCALLAARRSKDGGRRFSFQLGADRRTLTGIYRRLRETEATLLSPGGERLLDEYYVIERAFLECEETLTALPRGLPITVEGERAGLPRIYNIAAILVGGADARISEAEITAAIDAFQSVEPLRMAELWALPLMLRIALLKRLRLLGENCLSALRQYRLATETDTLLRHTPVTRREGILQKLEPGENPILTERLLMLLTERDAYGEREMLCACLKEAAHTPETLMERSRRVQEEDAASIQNAIASLKYLDSTDYPLLFERLSRVDAIFCEDGVYRLMDGPSRAFYRDAAAHMAAKLHVAEATAARAAVDLTAGESGKAAHIGYYLLDAGQSRLASGLRPDRRPPAFSETNSLVRFIALELLLTVFLLYCVSGGGIFAMLISFLPAWSIASFLATRLFMAKLPARQVPRLRTEVVADAPTLVVLPVLTVRENDVADALRQLETHYLANPLPGCSFAVLGDFKDTEKPDPAMEKALLRRAAEGVGALNRRYGGTRFFFLQRKQVYVETDGLYMGYERKRGAVAALLKLLTAGDESPFAYISAPLPQVESCVTLDADTMLPPESLGELIGAMRHPLNQPEMDENGVVVRGYGLIVPLMRAHATGAAKSPFARIVSGASGMDSYSSAVSEFYQDVFGTGIFGGKGIFDVKTFAAIERHVPENTILSHDLLEGSLARAGFMGDVSLYDAEPAAFLAWWKRGHRWVRGDWQLIPFLLPNTRNAAGRRVRNPLSPLSRYKILDNLRRSLLLPAVFQGLILMPFLGYGAYIALLILSLCTGFLADCLSALPPLFRGRLDIRIWCRRERNVLLRLLLDFATLPYSAWQNADAATRSLYRSFISHRHMLEWQTTAQSSNRPESLRQYYTALWPCMAAALYLVLSFFFGRTLLFCTIFALLWIGAPLFVKLTDQPPARRTWRATRRTFLMELALSTWKYFETYANETTGFLPPDNVQQSPQKPPVNNTSPTNIGMGFLACVAAYDLGFLPVEGLVTRVACMLDTVEDLEKWHGHLYNWYGLEEMEPLSPRYVSTVDSGNLVASLLLCEQALLHLPSGETALEGKNLAQRCRRLALETDFRTLYDDDAHLFYIGYDAAGGHMSNAHYDLLASESRLTSLVAVALHQVERRHWFSLGRLLTDAPGGRTLFSWSGTMFEYLMPLLFTGTVVGTLLHESCEAAIETQRRYAGSLPWGISESGYYAFDRSMYYQYHAFGVPRLGLCPTREEIPMVIAPYASALALPLCPEAADNLQRLADMGMLSAYGMYESLDLSGEEVHIVQSYMAHHQGMSLCAIDNALLDGALTRRFMAVPEIHAVRLLLEECSAPSIVIRDYQRSASPLPQERKQPQPRRSSGKNLYPEAQLLTNGSYTVFLTEDGVGFSRCGNCMLTRYRPDVVRGDSGLHVFLSGSGECFEIAGGEGEFLPSCIRLARREGNLQGKQEIVVPHQRNGEIRKLTVTNFGPEEQEITVGVFAEICLASEAEDRAHPAFNRIRVEAERAGDVLLFHRRANGPWLYCTLAGGSGLRFSTDALQFPGRFRRFCEAMAEPLLPGQDISLPVEPMCHMRAEVRVHAGMSAELCLVMGLAESREQALADAAALCTQTDALPLAAAHAESALRFAGIGWGKANLFERMATRLLLHLPQKREKAAGGGGALAKLWRLGISGDAPIVLFFVESIAQLRMAKTLMEFSAYLAARGIGAEVVIVGEYPMKYDNPLQNQLSGMQSAYPESRVLHGYMLMPGEREALMDAAMFCIDSNRSLDRQFMPPMLSPKQEEPAYRPQARAAFAAAEPKLCFGTALGGFDPETGEYVIQLRRGEHTPLPWCNVLCNGKFGTLLSESGGGYSWCGNSRENKITPWYNDPLRDPQGEMLLLMDAEDGAVWTLTPGRLQGESLCTVRHGFGYTEFRTQAEEIRAQCTVFADLERPLKYMILRFSNPMMRARRLHILHMIEWVLGEYAHQEAIETHFTGAIAYARNLRSERASAYIAMAGADKLEYSGDRIAILNGGWDEVQLQEGPALGTAFSAIRGEIILEPGETREMVLLTGEAGEPLEYFERALDEAGERLSLVRDYWARTLGAFTVETPDAAADLMINRWLPYQTRVARLWARTGYYQCGGATGFRDQLQDMLSLKLTEPEQLRAHILFCAAHQFEAGDVLHWWHDNAKGVRTDIRDDRLFLCYALLEYLEATEDESILAEPVAYLRDMPIPEGKHDLYAPMEAGECVESLYAHCVRAIESISFGAHGLPHMGGGDWNDAMDKVGKDGGESVWLGWFLLHILERFAPLAEAQGEFSYGAELRARTIALRAACESAWDGAWYRRAYYGDGSPLGSRENACCSIDCISQSWASIEGAAHAEEAMDSLSAMLMDEENGIVKILTPPFDGAEAKNPGYIMNYLPGVRENGGQYTHGAAWAVLGAAALGRKGLADKIFSMLNPISHTETLHGQKRYKAEPYVVAADVYAHGRIKGRAGWTWYTGAAAWLYMAGVEHVLGIKRRGQSLSIAPCTNWGSFAFHVSLGETRYHVRVERTEAGEACPALLPLADDGQEHEIVLKLQW